MGCKKCETKGGRKQMESNGIDQQWLDGINIERKNDQLDHISYEAFEIVMDRLEKEWFALIKRIPSRFSIGAAEDEEEFPEDSNCALCDDSECENLNAIVFCDGCNLAVHQDCYGVPFIPEGQWLCRKCTVSPNRPVSCALCPQEGGAFKQTIDGTWAHLLCAMWIPETGVSNSVYMEPIDGINAIPKARWRLRCYLCQSRHGACIQCEHRSCFTAFHVMCARRAGLLSHAHGQHEMEEQDTKPDGPAAYCHHHLPPAEKAALLERVRSNKRRHDVDDSRSEIDADDNDNDTSSLSDICVSELMSTPKRSSMSAYESIASKSARAYNQLYSSGPLPVPNYMVNRVLDYIARVPMRRKPQTVHQIVRYWSLKRQQMRGAPLLKRLHIEPWTVGNFVDERTHALKLAKLQFLYRLREDLEKVRLLAELVRKREKTKLRQMNLFQMYILDKVLLSKQTQLRQALERVMSLDKAQWFLHPVSKADAPGYYDIIKQPMNWSTIRERIDTMAYTTWEEWEADVRLVCENATQYNQPHSPISKAAQKIMKHLPSIVEDVRDPAVWDEQASSNEGLEPSDAFLHMLQAPLSMPDGIAIGAPSQDASVMDAFLEQWYTLPPVAPPIRQNDSEASTIHREQSKTKRMSRQSTEPTRRSTRRQAAVSCAQGEPLATSASSTVKEPRIMNDINTKDSFKYFNVGWLLPPGTRRGNRPRPRPASVKPRKRQKASPKAKVNDENSSSLSELSDDEDEHVHVEQQV